MFHLLLSFLLLRKTDFESGVEVALVSTKPRQMNQEERLWDLEERVAASQTVDEPSMDKRLGHN